MTSLSTLLIKARADVDSCIGIWTELLEERFSDIIEYAYSKGSAVKKWDSEIDYVPLLSDVDIHFRIRDGNRAFGDGSQGLTMAMDAASEYELRFRQRNSKHLHLPRTQLILLNDLEKDPFYVPPRLDDVRIMLGELSKKTPPSNDRVREIDLAQLDLLGPYLEALPMSAVDRTGLDWWTLVRQMGWRVSPSPVRLLSQVYEEPLDVWSWNRTRLCRELKSCGNNEVETSYREFYLAGWQLFQSGLKNPERFRLVVSKGYDVLAGCYRASRPK
jgi:hypothetical protein